MKYFVTQKILSHYAFLSLLTAYPAFKVSNNINRLYNPYCIRNLFNNVVCKSGSTELNDSIIMIWKECGRRWSCSNLKYYSYTYLQILKKAARHLSQDSRCCVQDLNSALPIYKPELLLLGPTCRTRSIKNNLEWFLISPLVNFETHGTLMFFVKVFLMFNFTMRCLNLQIMNPNIKKRKLYISSNGETLLTSLKICLFESIFILLS